MGVSAHEPSGEHPILLGDEKRQLPLLAGAAREKLTTRPPPFRCRQSERGQGGSRRCRACRSATRRCGRDGRRRGRTHLGQ